jgi:AcrR family transcriptional regulator
MTQIEYTDQAQERRREIVAEAAKLFEGAGYHRVGVAEIAAACGIRKPTFYHYFKGKEELLFAIHDEFIDIVLEREAERARGPKLDPADAVFRVLVDVMSVIETHRAYVVVFFEHFRELSEEDRAAISSKRDRFERALRKHLEAGMKTGAFRKMNVDLTARAVLGMCNWAYQWYRPDGPQSSREIASLCWDIAINGLASDGDIPVPQV